MASHTAGYGGINNREKVFTFENLNKIQSNKDISGKDATDLSVSFLFKPNWDSKIPIIPSAFKDFVTENDKRDFFISQRINSAQCKLTSTSSSKSRTSIQSDIFFDYTSEKMFKPNFMSTPKHEHGLARQKNTHEFSSLTQNIRVEKTASIFKPKARVSSQCKKHKLSLSAHVFHTVNDSCASIFKTLGNILFKNNDGSEKDILGTNIKSGEKAASYDFTKYMALRDVLINRSKEKKNCSCNKAIQRELDYKNHQKRIVKKIKTGIYLYGCNFKKISQNMWPHEKQMTPKVLYDIYRTYVAK